MRTVFPLKGFGCDLACPMAPIGARLAETKRLRHRLGRSASAAERDWAELIPLMSLSAGWRLEWGKRKRN